MPKLPHDKTLEKKDTLGAGRRGVRANIAESALMMCAVILCLQLKMLHAT
jgi:hypothetical protein